MEPRRSQRIWTRRVSSALAGWLVYGAVPDFPVTAHPAEPVNIQGAPTCPVLGGRPGVCLDESAARSLRDGVLVELPACQEKLKLREDQAKALEAAIAAAKQQLELAERAGLARKEESDKLREALSSSSKPNRALWMGIGLAVGAAATVGIVYALRPAAIGR